MIGIIHLVTMDFSVLGPFVHLTKLGVFGQQDFKPGHFAYIHTYIHFISTRIFRV